MFSALAQAFRAKIVSMLIPQTTALSASYLACSFDIWHISAWQT